MYERFYTPTPTPQHPIRIGHAPKPGAGLFIANRLYRQAMAGWRARGVTPPRGPARVRRRG